MSTAKGRVRKKKEQSEKPPPTTKFNQFGERMAMARVIQTVVLAYECTECGALTFGGVGGKMPFRCSNRKECGKPFHGLINENQTDGSVR